MITIRRNPQDRILELGGGSNPYVHPKCLGGHDCAVDVRMCQTPDGKQTVDFTADFNEPLPIESGEFDAVFSHFLIEHVSWRKVKQLISEMFRVVKEDGKCVCITANTEAQFQYIKDHPNGWDGREAFESFSCVLFGDQDYPENTHRNFMSPEIISQLFSEAGFSNIVVQPYGTASTDLCIEAIKPKKELKAASIGYSLSKQDERSAKDLTGKDIRQITDIMKSDPVNHKEQRATIAEYILNKKKEEYIPTEPPKGPFSADKIYTRSYFERYQGKGFYWDYPSNHALAKHVLDRKPKSVLELGCGRGYVLKRISDTGISCTGLDISQHCYLSRVDNNVEWSDVMNLYQQKERDLCFSFSFLEHVPEYLLPSLSKDLKKFCKRGLHGISLIDDGMDNTRCTIRPKQWWIDRLPSDHEVFDIRELESTPILEDTIRGDGKIKLNIGSYMTMFMEGWINIDIHDLSGFASTYNYKFLNQDVRNGLPYGTGVVDLVYCSDMLNYLDYKEGLAFLRDCRRVIRKEGCLRISLPDAEMLMDKYRTSLSEYDEVSASCANSNTQATKLFSLLHENKKCFYDLATLEEQLKDSGWISERSYFRHCTNEQMFRETMDFLPCLNLYIDATPNFSS